MRSGVCFVAYHNEFELMGKVGMGQYIPTGSVIHHLDARTKLMLGVLVIGTVIFVSSITALLLLFLTVLFGLFLAKVEVKLAFVSLRYILPYLFVLAAIQMFAVPQFRVDAEVIWKWEGLLSSFLSLRSFLSQPAPQN